MVGKIKYTVRREWGYISETHLCIYTHACSAESAKNTSRFTGRLPNSNKKKSICINKPANLLNDVPSKQSIRPETEIQ